MKREEFLAGADLRSVPPASDAVCERNSSPKHIRENSPGKDELAPSPARTVDPNEDQDMHGKGNQSVPDQE
jgi:hypothetical protein